MLAADPDGWVRVLRRLIMQTDDAIRSAGARAGEEREQVLADLRSERAALAAALKERNGDEITGPDETTMAPAAGASAPAFAGSGSGSGPASGSARSSRAAPEPELIEDPVLQASWADGRVVVWAGGLHAPPGTAAQLDLLLKEVDGGSLGWEPHAAVSLPGGFVPGGSAEAKQASIGPILGWLVAIGAGHGGEHVGASLRWLGQVALWGTQLVAEGRMVPVLRGSAGGSGGRGSLGRHRVRWVPALVERDRLAATVADMPGALSAVQTAPQPDGICRSVLSAVVDAISRAGAGRLVAPAVAPEAT